MTEQPQAAGKTWGPWVGDWEACEGISGWEVWPVGADHVNDLPVADMLRKEQALYLVADHQQAARIPALERALRAQEAWEADMILNAPDAWWDLQTEGQNDALVAAQVLRNDALNNTVSSPDREVGNAGS